MHGLCMEIAPALFADAGPGCLRGACPEGAKSCGRARQIRDERRALIDSLQTIDERPTDGQE